MTTPQVLCNIQGQGTVRGGARVAHVYPRPQDSAPQDMASPSCYYRTPAPIATQPVSIPRSPSPRPSHRKPRSKDLHYDGKSSWKSFLHKFVRLARSEQWAEVEQHDQFCVALESTASDYCTLLLETNPGVRLGPSLRSLSDFTPPFTHGTGNTWERGPPFAE